MTNFTLKHYLPYLLLAAIMLVLAWLPEQWQNMLQYNYTDITAGEYWRLITGHLLHSNTWHLIMNIGGLLLAMALHAVYFSYRQLAWQWLLCAVAIGLALYYFSPDIRIYVGLSGLLHAMLALGAIKDIQLKMTTGWLLLIGLVAKVIMEQCFGPDTDLAELINANVAVDAHLYGVISGIMLGVISSVFYRIKTVLA
ncbi:rhombosortase [Rheinheimera sp. D18]|uniref:rhombosortase n=1 Tax=Rheinheimera sp. D18 TaxID=2545632 RepID=UPI001FB790F6|nr:rhombosortase [Rheinheimera sp. D18]